MEDEIPYGEFMLSSRDKNSFIEKVFYAVVEDIEGRADDIKICSALFKDGKINRAQFLNEFDNLLIALNVLSKQGRMIELIEKKETIIIDALMKDLGMEFANSRT